jgi:hypothetical protein
MNIAAINCNGRVQAKAVQGGKKQYYGVVLIIILEFSVRCFSSYSGSSDQENRDSRSAWAKIKTLFQKHPACMHTQKGLVEWHKW